MKLPYAERCIVQDNKILGYLLNPDHPKGRSKAKFFLDAGFIREDIEEFRSALLQHARVREIAESRDLGYGIMHALRCEMSTPNERNPCVTTVWIIDTGSDEPRLVTAIPENQKGTAA